MAVTTEGGISTTTIAALYTMNSIIWPLQLRPGVAATMTTRINSFAAIERELAWRSTAAETS